jgi:DNA polymerase (family 10)
VKHNLHVHSTFSDGLLSPEQICGAALQAGFTHIGLADHFASVKLPRARTVGPEKLRSYLEKIQELKREYRGSLHVLAGLEIAFSLFQTDFTALFCGQYEADPLRDMDFFLFEYVNDDGWSGLDLRELLKVRGMIRGQVGLAHTDVDRNFRERYRPAELACALAEGNIFLELCPSARNSWMMSSPAKERPSRFLPYYRVDSEYTGEFFEEARKSGVLFSIGTDTHDSMEEMTQIQDAVEFLQEKGLQDNLVLRRFPPGSGDDSR